VKFYNIDKCNYVGTGEFACNCKSKKYYVWMDSSVLGRCKKHTVDPKDSIIVKRAYKEVSFEEALIHAVMEV
jgi:hypothetical protein